MPAPVGAGLAFLPIYFWLASGREEFANPIGVGIWMLLVAFLLISNMPTFSWSRVRPPNHLRIGLLALVGLLMAALLTEPWLTLAGITVVYLALIPFGVMRYLRVRRRVVASPVAPGGPQDQSQPVAGLIP